MVKAFKLKITLKSPQDKILIDYDKKEKIKFFKRNFYQN
tara:strand:+ start:1366 stop:1482 length:117 start_codon:yes stop_codon:yes gene_type:complete